MLFQMLFSNFSDVYTKYPKVWEIYGIEKTPFPTPLPIQLLKREVWRNLPREVKGTEPMLVIPPSLTLSCEKRIGIGKTVLELEKCTIQRIVYSGIVAMSVKQDITHGFPYKQAARGLKSLKTAAEKDGRELWIGGMAYIDIYVAKQLRIICSAMEIDYDSMTELGEYAPGRSVYAGFGSLGAIGAAGLLSAGSSANAHIKGNLFMLANMYTAFNNIVDYFNELYYHNEWNVWKNKQVIKR
ncbi:MAG: hypothetical protein LBK23_10455 [Oscillospiraceae bacterium]|jgi:hypothetical protein|nr:hypothetical protein [Oscillospiraceae bacterium]